MTAYIIRRLWQMVPTLLGVVLLVFVLFNWVGGDPAYVLAGKISNQEQIDNIRRQLGVDQPYYVQLGIFVKQIAHRRLRRVVEHQRDGLEHPDDAPRPVADRAGAAAHHRDDRRDRPRARRRLRARLADRPHGDDRLHGRAVDLDPRLHHRLPVRVRLQVRLVPRAGLGQQLLGEPVRLRVAADPDRRWSSASRRTCACTARSCSTRSTRTTCARRARRAWARTGSCGCTCCATRRSRSSPT